MRGGGMEGGGGRKKKEERKEQRKEQKRGGNRKGIKVPALWYMYVQNVQCSTYFDLHYNMIPI